MKLYEFTTEITICALPADHIDHHLFAVQVAWKDVDGYAVTRLSARLDRDGQWSYGPPECPEDEYDAAKREWQRERRFPLDEALRLAREAAPKVRVNGYSVADVLARGES